MKVVGVGLNRTGTTTLSICLRNFKFNHISFSKEAFELLRGEGCGALLQWVDKFDSFADWPWPLIYKEIDKAFPGTKFILTRRKDAGTWFRSLCNHAKQTDTRDTNKYIYGFEVPFHKKDEHLRFYEDHIHAIREYFRERPDDLLEVCWEEGDGWDQLSAFLGFERPNIPFPHANKSPTLLHKGISIAKGCIRWLFQFTP